MRFPKNLPKKAPKLWNSTTIPMKTCLKEKKMIGGKRCLSKRKENDWKKTLLIKKKRKWLEENVAYQKEKKMIGRKRCYANVGNVKGKPTNKTEKHVFLEKQPLARRMYLVKVCLATFLWSQWNLYFVSMKNTC